MLRDLEREEVLLWPKPMTTISRMYVSSRKKLIFENIFITTSGDFNTKGLLFCIDLVGVDRVLFSIGMYSS